MEINFLPQLYGSIGFFLSQSVAFIFKLIVAYIIWLIGKFIIDSAVTLLRKADIKQIKIDDEIRNTLIWIGVPTSKVILMLVILDFLGIGSNIMGAVAQGITFTIAIMLGISFGEALKPEARRLVEKFKTKTDLDI